MEKKVRVHGWRKVVQNNCNIGNLIKAVIPHLKPQQCHSNADILANNSDALIVVGQVMMKGTRDGNGNLIRGIQSPIPNHVWNRVLDSEEKWRDIDLTYDIANEWNIDHSNFHYYEQWSGTFKELYDKVPENCTCYDYFIGGYIHLILGTKDCKILSKKKSNHL